MSDDIPYFADVWLPVAVPGKFTYRISREHLPYIKLGQRVWVPFGKKKKMAGIVHAVHQQPPAQYLVKYIEDLLDENPLTTTAQLRLWDWVAQYYFCAEGEVMQAALPPAFRLHSETRMVLKPDLDLGEQIEASHELLKQISKKGSITLQNVEKEWGKEGKSLLKKWLAEGILTQEEMLEERFKPKTEAVVVLVEDYRSEEALSQMLNSLKRAPKQQDLLMAFLSLSRFLNSGNHQVKKADLLMKSGVGQGILEQLCKKGVLDVQLQTISRIKPFHKDKHAFPQLSTPQTFAKQAIDKAFQMQSVVLLHGITASGKTEIYIHLIKQTLEAQKQVLYLLPEIALTTQIIQRLNAVFGERLIVYHSRFSEQERAELWKLLLQQPQDKPYVVLGARSAVWLPFQWLGLIIVDEEHEPSFKQSEPNPRYHARDVAIVLAKQLGAKVLLGSATPAIETYFKATQGKFGLIALKERYGSTQAPGIHCIDLRKELKKQRMFGSFAASLLQKVKASLKDGKQIIIFQNRRGYAPRLECQNCRFIFECHQCDISLTYHKQGDAMRCHYCGYSEKPPSACPACQHTDLRMKGYGTERIEDELMALFPDHKIKRMDADTTRSKYAFHQLIEDFAAQKVDILVGTQMITKGLDFEHVQMVVIPNADAMLSFPDFRAFERSFQLMTQVAGRAGRRAQAGEVYIQTYQPEHPVLAYVLLQDFQGFYQFELQQRRAHHYPPFAKLVYITLKHEKQDALDLAADAFAQLLIGRIQAIVLGPQYPSVERLRNRYQKRIMLKIPIQVSVQETRAVLQEAKKLFSTLPESKGIRFIVDIDPV